MKRLPRLLFLFVLSTVILLGAYWWWLNNDPAPEMTLTAAELFATYEADEATGDSLFMGKVLTVSGVIAEIGNDQQDRMTLLLREPDDFGGVMVTLTEAPSFAVAAGQAVEVTGECNGFLFDVVLGKGRGVQKVSGGDVENH